jgi:hypothetical protein
MVYTVARGSLAELKTGVLNVKNMKSRAPDDEFLRFVSAEGDTLATIIDLY